MLREEELEFQRLKKHHNKNLTREQYEFIKAKQRKREFASKLIKKAESHGFLLLDWVYEGMTKEEMIADMDNIIAEHKAEEAKNQT